MSARVRAWRQGAAAVAAAAWTESSAVRTQALAQANVGSEDWALATAESLLASREPAEQAAGLAWLSAVSASLPGLRGVVVGQWSERSGRTGAVVLPGVLWRQDHRLLYLQVLDALDRAGVTRTERRQAPRGLRSAAQAV